MSDRFFYHSFPRPHRGEVPEQQIEKGLKILALINKAGLILAPEIVAWRQPTEGGNSLVTCSAVERQVKSELSTKPVQGRLESVPQVANLPHTD
jgi:hypothetical protein